MISVAAGSATTVVSSNLGTVDRAAKRPDRTDADYFAIENPFPGLTNAMLHRVGGRLALISGRTHAHVFVSVRMYQPGRPNSNDGLRQLISSALSEFSLTATTGWRAALATASRP